MTGATVRPCHDTAVPGDTAGGVLRHRLDVSHITSTLQVIGMTSVALIGLGAMGARFAGRFLEAGHDVIVWNRTPEKAQELVSRGASAAATPAEAARNAEGVVTAVSDPEALRAVTKARTASPPARTPRPR